MSGETAAGTVLVVEADVMARFAIADYLRHCGYRVIEAALVDEAKTLLMHPEITIDIVLSAIDLGGSTDGFSLARWVRSERPGIDVVLAGTLEKAAQEAGELCEDGPHISHPYDPQQVVDHIKRLRNLRR
jgi:DNA-binding response OmpR family regulator